MSERRITNDGLHHGARDPSKRLSFDDEDVRLLGANLAGGQRLARHAENRAFAERFINEHCETFDLLAK